jgi:hypothetical protein
MNIKRPLMPGFIKRAEQKLLLNKPGIWSTRAHLVVYYGVLFLLVLAALCFLEPNDPRDYSTTEVWTGFVTIISGIGIIVWMIYLLRFNVFKKYGTIHPLHGLVTFLIYFICTGIIISFTYVHPVVETIRANMAYDEPEVVNDVNNINEKIYQLEYNQLQTPWKYDTVQLVEKVIGEAEEPSDTDYATPAPVSPNLIPRYEVDSAEFRSKIESADSLIKLTDSVYLVYETPKFRFLNPFLYSIEMKTHVLSDFELFRKIHGHRPASAQREKLIQEVSVLLKKYEYPANLTYPPLVIEKDDSPLEIIDKKYRLSDVDNSITHIFRKKYRWRDSDQDVFFRVFFYFVLGISLLIFIFRHTTIRTFFLSLLAGVLITIFTTLIAAFTRAGSAFVLGWMVFYELLFLFITFSIFRAKRRRAITGIALNLFVFLVTLMPMIITLMYYEYRQDELYHQTSNYIEPFDLNKYMIYAEAGGVVLLLVLLSTYISKVYRHWYSLPED